MLCLLFQFYRRLVILKILYFLYLSRNIKDKSKKTFNEKNVNKSSRDYYKNLLE